MIVNTPPPPRYILYNILGILVYVSYCSRSLKLLHHISWKDVTPENFISVLTGKKDMMKGVGSGKVIDSGPDDHLFVFFADHGAPGLIAFPSSRVNSNYLVFLF